MTARTVDKCLDEIDRLRLRNVSANANLAAAEFLLLRVAKVLPHLIADTPHNGAARDTLLEEIHELLSEPRYHPKLPDGGVESEGEAGDALPSGEGDVDV